MSTRARTIPLARSGRPRRDEAANVEARILDAAERVFLKHGYEGASMDRIAEVAHAGKTTIYARYAGKKALFCAVALRNVARVMQVAERAPPGATLEAKLCALGASILKRALGAEAIDLMRVTLAEARRFPEIADQAKHMARERGLEEVSRLLSQNGAPDGLDEDRRRQDAQIFMDLVVLPMVMRRLFGESLAAVQGEMAAHVRHRVAFFLAAAAWPAPAAGEA